MSLISDLQALDRASGAFRKACAAVTPAGLDGETPCANWTVSDLIDHLTGGNRFTVAILDGATAADALRSVQASFDGDGPRPTAAVESLQLQTTAFAATDSLDETFHHVAGELTGHQILRLRIHDLSIHAWDLSQAVDPARGLDASLVRWAIHELADPASLAARHMALRIDHPRTAYELLAAFGRRRGEVRE